MMGDAPMLPIYEQARGLARRMIEMTSAGRASLARGGDADFREGLVGLRRAFICAPQRQYAERSHAHAPKTVVEPPRRPVARGLSRVDVTPSPFVLVYSLPFYSAPARAASRCHAERRHEADAERRRHAAHVRRDDCADTADIARLGALSRAKSAGSPGIRAYSFNGEITPTGECLRCAMPTAYGPMAIKDAPRRF